MGTLIKSARIIDPTSKLHLQKRNILIDKNGIIQKIGTENYKANKTIEGKDLYVSIGWFDMKANFTDPGLEQKEDLTTGRAAAAAGGFTEVALIPNTEPAIQSKNEVKYVLSGNKHNLVQLYPISAVTRDCKGEDLTEMIDMHTNGAVAFSDGDKPIWNTDILLKTLQYLQKFNGILINKPEDKHLTTFGTMHEGEVSTMLGLKGMPALSEEITVRRDLQLLDYAGGKIHFSNISSAVALALIKKAKSKEKAVTCDVAISNLLYDDSQLQDFDTHFKVDPPLRNKKDQKALLKGVYEGNIDVIVSAHSPQDEESKKLEFDLAEFGMSTIQTFFPMLLQATNEENWVELVEKFTIAPRKILSLPIPVITEGEMANLTVFDPTVTWKLDDKTNRSRARNSPYFNREIKGKVLAVINNGAIEQN